MSEAGLFAAKAMLGPNEDYRGRPITPKTYTWDGGWVEIKEEQEHLGPVLGRRVALVYVTHNP